MKISFGILTNVSFAATVRHCKKSKQGVVICLFIAALVAPIRCTAPPKKFCGNALDLPLHTRNGAVYNAALLLYKVAKS